MVINTKLPVIYFNFLHQLVKISSNSYQEKPGKDIFLFLYYKKLTKLEFNFIIFSELTEIKYIRYCAAAIRSIIEQHCRWHFFM